MFIDTCPWDRTLAKEALALRPLPWSVYVTLIYSVITWLRERRMCTAQTDVTTRASTAEEPPATESERRASGAGVPGGGSRNCSDRESATSVCRSAYSTRLSLASTANHSHIRHVAHVPRRIMSPALHPMHDAIHLQSSIRLFQEVEPRMSFAFKMDHGISF